MPKFFVHTHGDKVIAKRPDVCRDNERMRAVTFGFELVWLLHKFGWEAHRTQAQTDNVRAA